MMDNTTEKITCPSCGAEIDVNEILYHQLEERLKKEFNTKLADQKKDLKEKEDAIDKQRGELEKRQRSVQAEIESGVKENIEKAKEELKKEARAEAEAQQSGRIKLMETEIKEKSGQVKELNKSKAEIERLKREKEELRDEIEVESEKKLTKRLKLEKEKIQKEEGNRNELRLAEKEEVINQLGKQLQEAQRKVEQGSSQRQGEIQELAIEGWLRETFPLDTVEEIKKGAQGADCLQIVNTRSGTNCGSIYYESKRTKSFQTGWIEKFKNDIREKNADIGVLVTESMPSDMERMGLRDGIWICNFDEFKGLSSVLRETIIQLNNVAAAQVDKGTKMEMIYGYLTGTEFRRQVEAIVEGFAQMQTDLDAEKRSIQGQWKKREKQIDKVLLSTTNMYGAIKGIAGSAIQSVKMLELSPPVDE